MGKTAAEAGWHLSRYNLSTPLPGTDKQIIANLFKGSCRAYTALELYLLASLDELDERHPILKHFADQGIIVNFDEEALLETMRRSYCGFPRTVGLTVCTTMNCNFDCTYCFENHRPGKMSPEVQDAVVTLAGKILEVSGAPLLAVTWFGGEPLMALDVIESLSGRFMAAAKEHHAEYTASIVTNGYLLTQETADMLGRLQVKNAEITVDGIGASHDATRHLAGGGGTFEHIMDNFRHLKLPFSVDIRHNVHKGNYEEYDRLNALVRKISQESGNTIICTPNETKENPVSRERADRPKLLEESESVRVGILKDVKSGRHIRKGFCIAQYFWWLSIDDKGNLYKCDEIVHDPEQSFATAAGWDPANPFETACAPDRMTSFLNTADLLQDEECRNCIWLPTCSGGCALRRLTDKRQCLSYKDHPEEYVLTLYRFLKKQGEL